MTLVVVLKQNHNANTTFLTWQCTTHIKHTSTHVFHPPSSALIHTHIHWLISDWLIYFAIGNCEYYLLCSHQILTHTTRPYVYISCKLRIRLDQNSWNTIAFPTNIMSLSWKGTLPLFTTTKLDGGLSLMYTQMMTLMRGNITSNSVIQSQLPHVYHI